MTVGELIEKLEKYDKEKEVFYYVGIRASGDTLLAIPYLVDNTKTKEIYKFPQWAWVESTDGKEIVVIK